MVIHNSYPVSMRPCLVQINFSDGDIGFYLAKDFTDGLSYSCKIIAIFKCKQKQ